MDKRAPSAPGQLLAGADSPKGRCQPRGERRPPAARQTVPRAGARRRRPWCASCLAVRRRRPKWC